MNSTGKRTILYLRVSTVDQDVNLQREFCHQVIARQNIPLDRVDEIVDHGVSARKWGIQQRAGLSRLLEQIRSWEVETLIVYDRDRIARNMVEYLTVYQECKQHGVEILLSNTSAKPVQDDFGDEAQLALYAQMEGNRIAKRTYDAQKFYPKAPFGYEKLGQRSTVRYSETHHIHQVKSIFAEFADSVTCIEEYKTFKRVWYKRLKVDTTKILTNSFYAACLLENDQVIPLNHIQPVVDVNTVLFAKRKLSGWGLLNSKSRVSVKVSLFPQVPVFCKICDRTMISTRRNGEVVYVCNHAILEHHKKPFKVPVEVVDEIISSTAMEIVRRLDHTSLGKKTEQKMQQIRFEIRTKRKRVEISLSEQRKNLLLKSDHQLELIQGLNACNALENEAKKYKTEEYQLSEALHASMSLIHRVRDALLSEVDRNIREIGAQLIERIYIGENHVHVLHRCAEFRVDEENLG